MLRLKQEVRNTSWNIFINKRALILKSLPGFSMLNQKLASNFDEFIIFLSHSVLRAPSEFVWLESHWRKFSNRFAF